MTRRRKFRNRFLYLFLLMLFFGGAWAYGGAMLYLALYSLILLPVFSFIVSFAAFRFLKITQRMARPGNGRIIKGEPGRYEIVIHNRTPLLFVGIDCLFSDDRFAVETNRQWQTVGIRPFSREIHSIDFRVRYRGHYRLGLSAVSACDMLGIFTLKRRLKETVALTVLPKLVELTEFPLAQNILSEFISRFEIREEDYSVVSDVRKYEPTDPLKRVHWKLTAKKNEWMVKNFQTNAQNKVTILMDTFKPARTYEDSLILEDKIIETAVAVINCCLSYGMPVAWRLPDGNKCEAQNLGQFDALFNTAADLVFGGEPETASVDFMLNDYVNEAAGNLNAVIFSTNPTPELYDKLVGAKRIGHSFLVLYFTIEGASAGEAEETFARLSESGIISYRITPETDMNF